MLYFVCLSSQNQPKEHEAELLRARGQKAEQKPPALCLCSSNNAPEVINILPETRPESVYASHTPQNGSCPVLNTAELHGAVTLGSYIVIDIYIYIYALFLFIPALGAVQGFKLRGNFFIFINAPLPLSCNSTG